MCLQLFGKDQPRTLKFHKDKRQEMQKNILGSPKQYFKQKSNEWKYLHFYFYRLTKSIIWNRPVKNVMYKLSLTVFLSQKMSHNFKQSSVWVFYAWKKSDKVSKSLESLTCCLDTFFLWLSLLSSCHNWGPNRFSTTTTIFLAYVVCRHLNAAHSGRFEEGKKHWKSISLVTKCS